MSSLIFSTAASRPALVVLVIWRYKGGFFFPSSRQAKLENEKRAEDQHGYVILPPQWPCSC